MKSLATFPERLRIRGKDLGQNNGDVFFRIPDALCSGPFKWRADNPHLLRCGFQSQVGIEIFIDFGKCLVIDGHEALCRGISS